MNRRIEIEQVGSVSVSGGTLWIHDAQGNKLAGIAPSREQWGQIAAEAVYHMRFSPDGQ